MMDWWRAEPAMITGATTSVILLLVAFGVPISEDQKVAVIGVVSAVLTLLGAIVVRQNVYSPASVEKLTGVDMPAVPN
jgi:hypothetical protein